MAKDAIPHPRGLLGRDLAVAWEVIAETLRVSVPYATKFEIPLDSRRAKG